jgi:hypothetical protein
MKNLKIILWHCLPFLFSSCLQLGNDTLILPTGEYYEVQASTIDVDILSISIQQELEQYMPLYEGATSPNVEGVFLFSSVETVYCSDENDGGYSPGELVDDFKIKLSNQDSKTNTLTYNEESIDGDAYSSSDDVYIIGNGNNFTAYFISSGISSNISTEEAILISGTLTSSGIKDVYYAIVMLDKGYDPDNTLMGMDEYRIFKDEDGLAENSTWSKSAKINSLNTTNPLIINKIYKK